LRKSQGFGNNHQHPENGKIPQYRSATGIHIHHLVPLLNLRRKQESGNLWLKLAGILGHSLKWVLLKLESENLPESGNRSPSGEPNSPALIFVKVAYHSPN
jgi:hypothetical protein